MRHLHWDMSPNVMHETSGIGEVELAWWSKSEETQLEEAEMDLL